MNLRVAFGTLAAMAMVSAVACGGGESKEAAPAVSAQPGAAQTAPARAAAALNPCPITEAQVTAAIGAPMKGPDAACGFDSADEKLVPHVLFILQNDLACREDMLAQMNFREKVDGLGVAAYTALEADGTHILVCRSGVRPFDIVVDTTDVARNRAVGMALAKQILGG